jgi:Tol biopolymer transport system component
MRTWARRTQRSVSGEIERSEQGRQGTTKFGWGGAALLCLLGGLSLLPVGYAQQREPLGRGESEPYVVFLSHRSGPAELYLLELETRQVTQLTQTGRAHHTPVVAPGARSLVFAAHRGAGIELFEGRWGAQLRTRRPTLVGLTRLTVNIMDEFSPSVTSDGQWIAFSSGNGIELMGSREAGQVSRQILLPTAKEFRDFAPSISPDGRVVAFVSDRSGAPELWTLDRRTREVRQMTAGLAALGGVSWRADGGALAVTTNATTSGLTGIALVDPASGQFRVVSQEEDRNAVFSAGGDRLLFSSMRDGDAEIYLLTLSTGKVQRLTESPGVDDHPVFLGQPPVAPTRTALP